MLIGFYNENLYNMKKIGFIYKYNPSEGMGILVFGVWKVKSSWGSTIKNTPILFSDNDLKLLQRILPDNVLLPTLHIMNRLPLLMHVER